MLESCNNDCYTTTGTAPALFASALNFFAATQCYVPDKVIDNTQEDEIYDFIVVGAGTAGSVVASRLSEIENWNILLLEAGPEPPIESDIPYMSASLYETDVSWQYYTKNNGVAHQALKYGSVFWPRGRMLGGSSSINAMYYVRGRDTDFQAWVNEGNPSWTPYNVRKYYRKAENLQDMNLLKNTDVFNSYGKEGPFIINTFNSTYRDTTQKILDSYDHLGFKKVDDVNTADFNGLGLSGIFRATAANGRRSSAYHTYIKPLKKRKNLRVVKHAFVTKILINENYEAYGVEVDINGKRKQFYANIEVIISGGTINTPQPLMLSGIGDCNDLSSRNIFCKVHLPGVGKNLQDHNFIYIPIYGDKPEELDETTRMFQVIEYAYNKRGYLAESALSDVSAFYSRNKSIGYPEFQNHMFLIHKNESSIRTYLSFFRDNILNSLLEYSPIKSLYLFGVTLLHPFSRGRIYLNTSDPYTYPIIEPNYYRDERDVQASADAIQMLTKIVNTPYFKSINAFTHRVNIPQCNQFEFISEDYWKCYLVNTGATVYHPVGTSKMGPNSDDSVVNNFLQVHKVRKLRVIDASVMPTLTSGNTNGPTIMIAEMGSDMIKDEYLGCD